MPVNFEGIDNRFAVPDIIAREALYRLKHHLVLPMIANKTYNEYFEKKVGAEITIKRPFKARVQSGRDLVKSQMVDKTVTLKLDKRFHFGLEVVDEDVTLRIEDYGARYLDTGAEELAYEYDIAGANELGLGLFLMSSDGATNSPGSAFSLSAAQAIRAHATKMAIPRNSQNFALLDPLEIAQVSADIQDIDMPEMVGQNIRESYRGMLGGWRVLESVHVPPMTTAGNPGMPTVTGAGQLGSSLLCGAFSASQTVLLKGQLIQIAGVYEVQPRGDRRSTGKLATFLVTDDVVSTAGGVATIPIYPEINDGTANNTTVNPNPSDGAAATLDTSAFQTVSASPGGGAAVTVVGSNADAKSYRQGIFFCGDALEYVNVSLAKPKSAVYAGVERDTETGVAISYVADFDINDMTEVERLDIFFGAKTVYPEIGIRWIGPEIGSGLA